MGDRERESNTNEKRKGRLDEIMKRTTNPGNVRLMICKEAPERIIRPSLGYSMESPNFGHHQKHDETAISVDRSEAKAGNHWRPGALRLFECRCCHWVTTLAGK